MRKSNRRDTLIKTKKHIKEGNYPSVRLDKNLKISEEAHKLLSGYGKKGETFDEIIKRLVKNVGGS